MIRELGGGYGDWFIFAVGVDGIWTGDKYICTPTVWI